MAIGPASTFDLQDRSLTTLTPDELVVADVKLDDVYVQIVTAMPSVVDRLALTPSDDVFTALVVQVQCAAVLRYLQNPEGKYQEAGDDYSFSRDQTVATGALYVTPAELALLAATGGSENAFTIRPTGRTPDYPWTSSLGLWGF